MLCCLLLAVLPQADGATFDSLFTGRTIRVDYDHAGTAGEEHLCLERVRVEGDWPGNRQRLIDDTNLGEHLVEVVDPKTNRTIYSRGFSSIFQEWQTTGEASEMWRSFQESVRLPEPRAPFQVVFKRRSKDGTFREVQSWLIDPASRFVERSPIEPRGEVWTLFENGEPSETVDILVLGDGYTAEEKELFRDDVNRLMHVLFETEPFKTLRDRFSVRAISLASRQSGVTEPRSGQWRRSPLGLSYNAFDSERYVLTYANDDLREIAAQAPYDTLILLANQRKYGGGGIFNLWCTAAARSEQAPYLVVHEFGHSFAGLADEYYTSQVAYEDYNPEGREPWEPNITALLDSANLKWKDLADASLPIPTPWNQERYDELSLSYQKRRAALRESQAGEDEVEALFRAVKAESSALLSAEEHYSKVGAFEGGGYRAKGIWRPSVDCIMFTRNPDSFCPVCARGIERVVELVAGR